ncbi:uncharacterized protein DS421_19g675220 [Arachis hypogaea]|uniref:Uncharacterized protein n=1 Tax=Arachis hypogaea TaxID=3818 RepID=A0A6B9VHI4_ARAHY|nr:uncharacterized protein DS421_19g675220 [Arachis hypogaea]
MVMETDTLVSLAIMEERIPRGGCLMDGLMSKCHGNKIRKLPNYKNLMSFGPYYYKYKVGSIYFHHKQIALLAFLLFFFLPLNVEA